MMYLTLIAFLFSGYAQPPEYLPQARLHVICLAPAVYGSRGDSEIIDKIQQKTRNYSSCYAANFTASTASTFKVRFRFVIKPSGQVTKITVIYTGTKNSEFMECLQGIVEQILFDRLPNADGDTVVEQSILFRLL